MNKKIQVIYNDNIIGARLLTVFKDLPDVEIKKEATIEETLAKNDGKKVVDNFIQPIFPFEKKEKPLINFNDYIVTVISLNKVTDLLQQVLIKLYTQLENNSEERVAVITSRMVKEKSPEIVYILPAPLPAADRVALFVELQKIENDFNIFLQNRHLINIKYLFVYTVNKGWSLETVQAYKEITIY